jgi:arsenite methyltransferase
MSCCNNNTCAEKPKFSSSSEIIGVVNAAYSARAREGVSAECASAHFESTLHSKFFIHESIYFYTDASNVAKAFGYTEEQLKAVPEAAHMGLSCGNPIATASIKEVS